MKIPNTCSWTWKNLLKLRGLVQGLIIYEVGNDEGKNLWWGNQHPLGPLIEKFGRRIQYDSGTENNAKVSQIMSNGEWAWPRQNSDVIAYLIAHTSGNFRPDQRHEDYVWWKPELNGYWTVKRAWNTLRNHKRKSRMA